MKTRKTFLLLAFFVSLAVAAQAGNNVQSLTPTGFEKVLDTKHPVLIDVRTADEFAAGHIPGAINIDVNNPDFSNLVKKQLTGKKTLAVYCRTGHRSKIAVQKLSDLKTEIYELDHGFMSWQEAGLSVKK